jgi:hypothetical protein
LVVSFSVLRQIASQESTILRKESIDIFNGAGLEFCRARMVFPSSLWNRAGAADIIVYPGLSTPGGRFP